MPPCAYIKNKKAAVIYGDCDDYVRFRMNYEKKTLLIKFTGCNRMTLPLLDEEIIDLFIYQPCKTIDMISVHTRGKIFVFSRQCNRCVVIKNLDCIPLNLYYATKYSVSFYCTKTLRVYQCEMVHKHLELWDEEGCIILGEATGSKMCNFIKKYTSKANAVLIKQNWLPMFYRRLVSNNVFDIDINFSDV